MFCPSVCPGSRMETWVPAATSQHCPAPYTDPHCWKNWTENTELLTHFLFHMKALTKAVKLNQVFKASLDVKRTLKKKKTQTDTHVHMRTHIKAFTLFGPVLVFSGSPTFALAFGRIQHLTRQEDTQISENRKKRCLPGLRLVTYPPVNMCSHWWRQANAAHSTQMCSGGQGGKIWAEKGNERMVTDQIHSSSWS